MKKIISSITVLLLLLTLVGCNNKTDNDKNTLKIGMDLRWPPFETKDESGNPTGISYDLALELGEYLGREVEVIDTDFGSLIPALETGKIDVIIGSMSITEERSKKINFSDPYFYFPLVTLLNKESNITSKEELFQREGLTFVGPKSFVALSIPLAEANNPIIREFDDSASAVLEVAQGRADAFIISPVAASEFHAKNPDTTELLWEPITSSPIGMGLRKDDIELLEQVNMFINGLHENGVYDRLSEKYDSVIGESLPGKGLEFYINE